MYMLKLIAIFSQCKGLENGVAKDQRLPKGWYDWWRFFRKAWRYHRESVNRRILRITNPTKTRKLIQMLRKG